MKTRHWIGIALVVTVVALVVTVFPTNTYLDQRKQLASERKSVAVLNQQNAVLSRRVKGLHTDGEIERIARDQYSLVNPGEEAYAILPGATTTTTAAAPKAEKSQSLWSRAVDTVTFWN